MFLLRQVNVNPRKLQQEADALKAAGVKVMTVGVGGADRTELRAAASEPVVDTAFFFNSYSSLRNDATATAVRNGIYACKF